MTLNLGSVDIRKTMEAAAEGVQDRLVKNGIELEIRAAADIGSFVADERRVRQSLFNLLANAVGFSPGGETVTFTAQRLKDAVVFSVTDRGPGIPDDVQDKVFDWFETHSLGSRHRGTGLGLSLVRSFVELHGGSVTLESAVGRGTTVTCVFPARPNCRAKRGLILACHALKQAKSAVPIARLGAIPIPGPEPDRPPMRIMPTDLQSRAMPWHCP